jgi:single-strand DNA-binding protein|tara:strand:+ start:389 stop:856 length:468 start_codon:yes stop_codon:yes gene_type:complete
MPPNPREIEQIMNNSAITCVGNVTADPKLEYTNNGAAKLRFSVACNRSWKNAKTDEWEEETSFFNVVCWRYQADVTAEVIEKGVGVIVVGRLEQRSWEDNEGNKRSTVEVVADNVAIQCRNIEEFTRKRGGKGGGSSNGQKAVSPRAKNEPEDPF